MSRISSVLKASLCVVLSCVLSLAFDVSCIMRFAAVLSR